MYDDPDTIYEIQSDGTTDPTLATARTHIGANAALTLTAASTASGQSQVELDYNTISAAITEAVKIVGLYEIANNDPALKNGRYLVQLQNHIQAKGVAGI